MALGDGTLHSARATLLRTPLQMNERARAISASKGGSEGDRSVDLRPITRKERSREEKGKQENPQKVLKSNTM